MSNLTGINICPDPFFDAKLFSSDGGFVDGRLCQKITDDLSCCLPCPMYEWLYPDSFNTLTTVANWVAAASVLATLFLLLSWAVLPVDKTARHYLSICLTFAVTIINLGFVVPLVAKPEQCFDTITPHNMHTSYVCGASGALVMLGGFSGVMWAFLRSVSLHLQICWQVLVGKNFMIFAQAAGWGVPIIGIVLGLIFSGVSFRFGPTCHINHENSLADFWIPLLIFAALTVFITFATFGYCVKVYLQSLSDNSSSTEGSSLPAYTQGNRVTRTVNPRQAYRRIKRVIHLQWRGIAIVLIIVADVIFFSIIFVFQDNIVQSVTHDPSVGEKWVLCLIAAAGDKSQCLDEASALVVNEATIGAVLLLLALNGIWLLFLLGRWSMVSAWIDLFKRPFDRSRRDFVSVDARHEIKKTELKSPDNNGRRTPDYFGQTAHYHVPTRSYSSPRPPPQRPQMAWSPEESYATPREYGDRSPLGMNRI